MENNYHIIILTIHRNKQRVNNIINILNSQGLTQNINYSLFYGIDYKNIKKNTLKNICRKGFKFVCPYSVLACASSHILLWKYISKLNFDYVIVLEDDTFININAFKNCKRYIEHLLIDSIIFIYSDCYFLGRKYTLKNNIKITYNPIFHVSMGCYLLKPDIARKLYYYYNINKIWFHIDFQLNFDIHNIGINRYVFNYNDICNQYDGNKSSMGIPHYNLFLKPIEDTKLMRVISTPIFRINNAEIDAYIIIMLLALISSIYILGFNISAVIFLFFILIDVLHSSGVM